MDSAANPYSTLGGGGDDLLILTIFRYWGGGGDSQISHATDSVTCFASEAARSIADRATAVVREHNPRWGFGGVAPGGWLGAKPPENVGHGEHL